MASSSSPALSNTTSDTNPNRNPPAIVTTTSPSFPSFNSTTNASKNLRGLNKPRCIKCGNVARSRCPYQSCKSCCAKAQNPCHIHVLKGNSTFPDKAPSTGSPSSEQQPTDASPSGNSQRVTSLRQLSSNFSQFNNLQSPLCSRKPLTRKEAEEINEWRYQKLKEYKDGNIEMENEAYDRYMRNVNLLEEVFNVNSTPEGRPIHDGGSPTSNANPTSVEDENQMAIAEIKSRLRSDPTRAENFRNRMQEAVDQGLKELQKSVVSNDVTDVNEQEEYVANPEKKKFKRTDALAELIDKLNKARNEEDLKLCEELKAQLFDRHTETSKVESVEPTSQNDASMKPLPDDALPKWFSAKPVDQEELRRMAERFDSLEEIEEL